MSLNPSRPHTTTTDPTRRRAPGTQHVSARRLSPRLISDAVVASYLHDISQRRRRSAPAPENHLALTEGDRDRTDGYRPEPTTRPRSA
jgi:hypothetical protein